MTTAFVLGNGKSRATIDLHRLHKRGPIYGCNWLCKTFTPDCLVATDSPIANEIQKSGYALKHRFHTRRPVEGSGAKTLPKDYKGMSSGPNALAQACFDGHYEIYLLGFDLGSTDGRFNNVYADAQFYKKIDDAPTFAGNWIKQIKRICEEFPDRSFIRVRGIESAHIPTLVDVQNLNELTIERFVKKVNIE